MPSLKTFFGSCFCAGAERKRFLTAAQNGQDQVAAASLANRPELITCTTLLHRKTALHLCAENGHAAVMASLLEMMAESASLETCKAGGAAPGEVGPLVASVLNSRDSEGRTALIIACSHNQIECARLLLANGAWRELVDDRGNSALHYASTRGYLGIMLLLLTEFLDELKEEQLMALNGHGTMGAVAAGRPTVTIDSPRSTRQNGNGRDRSVAPASASVPSTPRAGVSPPAGTTAAPVDPSALPDVTRLTNVRNSNGFSPLHFAVWSKQSGAVQVLLQHGADLIPRTVTTGGAEATIPCPGDSTPLHLAAMRGHIEISRILLKTFYERVMEPMQLQAAAVPGTDQEAVTRAIQVQDPRTQHNSMGLIPAKVAQRMGFLQLATLLRPQIPLARLFSEEEHRTRFYGPPALKLLAAEALNRKLVAALSNAMAMTAAAAAAEENRQSSISAASYMHMPPPPTTAAAAAAVAAAAAAAATAHTGAVAQSDEQLLGAAEGAPPLVVQTGNSAPALLSPSETASEALQAASAISCPTPSSSSTGTSSGAGTSTEGKGSTPEPETTVAAATAAAAAARCGPQVAAASGMASGRPSLQGEHCLPTVRETDEESMGSPSRQGPTSAQLPVVAAEAAATTASAAAAAGLSQTGHETTASPFAQPMTLATAVATTPSVSPFAAVAQGQELHVAQDASFAPITLPPAALEQHQQLPATSGSDGPVDQSTAGAVSPAGPATAAAAAAAVLLSRAVQQEQCPPGRVSAPGGVGLPVSRFAPAGVTRGRHQHNLSAGGLEAMLQQQAQQQAQQQCTRPAGAGAGAGYRCPASFVPAGAPGWAGTGCLAANTRGVGTGQGQAGAGASCISALGSEPAGSGVRGGEGMGGQPLAATWSSRVTMLQRGNSITLVGAASGRVPSGVDAPLAPYMALDQLAQLVEDTASGAPRGRVISCLPALGQAPAVEMDDDGLLDLMPTEPLAPASPPANIRSPGSATAALFRSLTHGHSGSGAAGNSAAGVLEGGASRTSTSGGGAVHALRAAVARSLTGMRRSGSHTSLASASAGGGAAAAPTSPVAVPMATQGPARSLPVPGPLGSDSADGFAAVAALHAAPVAPQQDTATVVAAEAGGALVIRDPSFAADSGSTAMLTAQPQAQEQVLSEHSLQQGALPAMSMPPSAAAAALAAVAAGLGELEDEDDECGICLEHPAVLVVQPCQHHLCGPCARKMCTLNAQRTPHCPFCRAIIADFTPNMELAVRMPRIAS